MSLEQGERCPDLDVCEPSACAGAASADGTSFFAACRNHRVELITMALSDMPGTNLVTPIDNGVSWDDCDAALAEGVSGEACTWAGKSCIRPAEDTCCREGAQCVVADLGNPDAEVGLLYRLRICAPGCENVEPDTTMPLITDCASAAEAALCRARPACAGDFTCYRTAGDWTLTEYNESSQVNGAMWCAGGMLVGGYGTSWGYY